MNDDYPDSIDYELQSQALNGVISTRWNHLFTHIEHPEGNRSGCGSGAQAVQPEATPISEEGLSLTPLAVFHADEIGGYLELVDALRAEGTIVEPTEEVEQAFFSVIGCFTCHLYSTIK